MRPIIEFCVNNIANCSQKAFETLEKDRSLDVVEYNCFGHCGKCSQTPLALVNGETVRGSTPEELVENIYTFMEEHEIF